MSTFLTVEEAVERLLEMRTGRAAADEDAAAATLPAPVRRVRLSLSEAQKRHKELQQRMYAYQTAKLAQDLERGTYERPKPFCVPYSQAEETLDNSADLRHRGHRRPGIRHNPNSITISSSSRGRTEVKPPVAAAAAPRLSEGELLKRRLAAQARRAAAAGVGTGRKQKSPSAAGGAAAAASEEGTPRQPAAMGGVAGRTQKSPSVTSDVAAMTSSCEEAAARAPVPLAEYGTEDKGADMGVAATVPAAAADTDAAHAQADGSSTATKRGRGRPRKPAGFKPPISRFREGEFYVLSARGAGIMKIVGFRFECVRRLDDEVYIDNRTGQALPLAQIRCEDGYSEFTWTAALRVVKNAEHFRVPFQSPAWMSEAFGRSVSAADIDCSDYSNGYI